MLPILWSECLCPARSSLLCANSLLCQVSNQACTDISAVQELDARFRVAAAIAGFVDNAAKEFTEPGHFTVDNILLVKRWSAKRYRFLVSFSGCAALVEFHNGAKSSARFSFRM